MDFRGWRQPLADRRCPARLRAGPALPMGPERITRAVRSRRTTSIGSPQFVGLSEPALWKLLHPDRRRRQALPATLTKAYAGSLQANPAAAPQNQPALPWLTWNNRPFVSPFEMAWFPRVGIGAVAAGTIPRRAPRVSAASGEGTRGLRSRFPKEQRSDGARHDQSELRALVEFLRRGASPIHANNRIYPGRTNNLYRLLEYVQVPSKFVGTETVLEPVNENRTAYNGTLIPSEAIMKTTSIGRPDDRDGASGDFDPHSAAKVGARQSRPRRSVWNGADDPIHHGIEFVLDARAAAVQHGVGISRSGPREHQHRAGRLCLAGSAQRHCRSAIGPQQHGEPAGRPNGAEHCRNAPDEPLGSQRDCHERPGNTAPLAGNGATVPNQAPSYFTNPFRSFAGAALTSSIYGPTSTYPNAINLFPMPLRNIDATLLRSFPVGAAASNLALFDSPAVAGLIAGGSPAAYNDPTRNPYFRLQNASRMTNLLTTRSNVYAVWITVGYFQASPWYRGQPANSTAGQTVYDTAHPDGYQLGEELGCDHGRNCPPPRFLSVRPHDSGRIRAGGRPQRAERDSAAQFDRIGLRRAGNQPWRWILIASMPAPLPAISSVREGTQPPPAPLDSRSLEQPEKQRHNGWSCPIRPKSAESRPHVVH